MLLDDAGWLVAASGAGVYSPAAPIPDGAVPVTLDGMPDTGGAAVAVSPYAGPEPDSRNGWEFPRLQVRVRASDPLVALQLDRDVFDYLQALAGIELRSGAYLQDCYALQSAPMPMGQDRNGRWEYSRNYQLTVKE